MHCQFDLLCSVDQTVQEGIARTFVINRIAGGRCLEYYHKLSINGNREQQDVPYYFRDSSWRNFF